VLLLMGLTACTRPADPDPARGLEVASDAVGGLANAWRFGVDEGPVDVVCVLDDDPDEVHRGEGEDELVLYGLLADADYAGGRRC